MQHTASPTVMIMYNLEEEYWNNLCDHRESLQRFRRVFGKSSVIPRLFISDSFVDNSLIMDFLHAAHIKLPKKSFRFPSRQNESISALGLEILRKLNMQQPMFLDDGTLNPIRVGVPKLFQSIFTKGTKFRISSELANEYRLAYSTSNEWVRREYFPEREKLFPEISQDNSLGFKLDDHEIDQFADLLNSLLKGETLSARALLRLLIQKIQKKLKNLTKQ